MDGEVNGVSQDKNVQHRANTTMHVCWHRNTSVSMRDHERAIKVSIKFYSILSIIIKKEEFVHIQSNMQYGRDICVYEYTHFGFHSEKKVANMVKWE